VSFDEARFERGPPFDLVVIAASAGGLSALGTVVRALPGDLPSSVCIVQHLDPRHRSLIDGILARHTELTVRLATEGERLKRSTVYVAPPDRHLLVNADGTMSLTQSELVHFVRPSADLLFESAAHSHGDRVIAVVLTGTGKDASMGVQAVKQRGGTVIAQDQETSQFFGMPEAAIQTGAVDFILPLDQIGPAIVTLVTESGR
jgi:two-component system chemotaxis response regulator CheB